MSKTIKNCFYKNLTFEKMMAAHKRAKQHKTSKDEIIRFEFNLENNIINLINSIRNNTYKSGHYYVFTIYEPKKREIRSLPYRDRVVHQWYIEEFIKPYIIPRFIDTTFACLTNRGTHKAVDKVQNYLRKYEYQYKNYWILKCDIKGFFYNIDQNILYKIMCKYISDKALLDFTKLLIYNNIDSNQVGIPIGNLTSQYFANIYLNELDYYVKYIMKVDTYVRYMDDFVMLFPTKEQAKIAKQQIFMFVQTKLHLDLNSKSKYYPSKMGVNFCGYRIFSTHKLLRTNSKKKMKRNILNWNKLYEQKKLDIARTMLSINSWKGHISHCNSYKLEKKMLNNCKFLYDTQESNQNIAENFYINFKKS